MRQKQREERITNGDLRRLRRLPVMIDHARQELRAARGKPEAVEIGWELERMETERGRLERFIARIEDGELRRLFILHYRQGKSWQRCATELGYTSEAWARHKAMDYLRRKP